MKEKGLASNYTVAQYKPHVNTDADFVFSVTGSRRNPCFTMVKKTENGYVRVIESSFRQEAREVFDMNASLYAYNLGFIESGKGIFDGKCDVIKMMVTAVLDLDHENDFKLMQIIGEYLFNLNSELKKIKDNIKEIMK